MQRIRAGIIGMGVMGEIFHRCLKDLPVVDLVAVVDTNPANLARWIEDGLAGYADYRDMLSRECLDAVLICTPDDCHFQPVMAACDAGIHIFLEKPLSIDLDEGRKIVAAADGYAKVFMIGHTLRYDPRFVSGRQSVASGEIGDILHIRSWRESVMAHGLRLKGRCSSMLFLGVHDLDICNWYMGCKARRVHAMSASKKLKGMGVDVPDAMFAQLEYENGAIAQVATSWVLPQTQGQTRSSVRAKGLEIVGTRGMISIDADNIGVTIQTEESISFPDILYNFDMHGTSFGIYREEMSHFVACIEGRTKPATVARDAYYAVAAACAIEQSVMSGLTVAVDNSL